MRPEAPHLALLASCHVALPSSVHTRLPVPSSLQGPVYEYDVIGHPQCDFHFAVTFPWHPGPGGGSVTLLREYAQVRAGVAVHGGQGGKGGMLYNLVPA